MVSMSQQLGTKRKYNQVFSPAELSHKFQSKSDFFKYMKESCKYSYFAF